MATEHLLGTPEAVKKLSDKLARCKAVSRIDVPGAPESPALAQFLADVEKSAHRIDAELRQLVEAADPERTERSLRSIGEELRQITSSVRFSLFYGYLQR